MIETIEVHITPRCAHRNGWYKSVTYRWWMFTFTRRFFLCTDCHDLVPMEEFNDIRKREMANDAKKMFNSDVQSELERTTDTARAREIAREIVKTVSDTKNDYDAVDRVTDILKDKI